MSEETARPKLCYKVPGTFTLPGFAQTTQMSDAVGRKAGDPERAQSTRERGYALPLDLTDFTIGCFARTASPFLATMPKRGPYSPLREVSWNGISRKPPSNVRTLLSKRLTQDDAARTASSRSWISQRKTIRQPSMGARLSSQAVYVCKKNLSHIVSARALDGPI